MPFKLSLPLAKLALISYILLYSNFQSSKIIVVMKKIFLFQDLCYHVYMCIYVHDSNTLA